MQTNNNDVLDELNTARNNARASQLTSLYDQGQSADQQMTNAQAGTTPATPTTPAATGPVTTQNRVNEINRMYDAQNAARLAQLQSAYDINRSGLQAAADQIVPNYQQQANANAVDWERQRRNFLEGAATSGINTGANSQYQLAMMGQNQRNMNTLRMAQVNAQNEAARNLANLGVQYQADVNAANANVDAQRAAALIDEYEKGYNRDAAAAEALAAYGDFSGYAGLYGDDIAKGMADFWAQQNPDIAYVTNRITKDQYDNIKAKRPINDGLDENGKRIKPKSSGGGYMSDPWGYGGAYTWGGSGGGGSSSLPASTVASALSSVGSYFGR